MGPAEIIFWLGACVVVGGELINFDRVVRIRKRNEGALSRNQIISEFPWSPVVVTTAGALSVVAFDEIGAEVVVSCLATIYVLAYLRALIFR